MLNSEELQLRMRQVQQRSPLVHCITNDVVTNFTANVLLAIGASPAMVVAEEESAEFAAVASALSLNVGTVTPQQARSMHGAAAAAHRHGRPWVLDPVAYGAIAFRTEVCRDLLQHRPTVIRGNASEISAMAGSEASARGADSAISSTEAVHAAIGLAAQLGTVVALTGEVDYVTDGKTTFALGNGDAQLTRVTGTGCALSAMVAAYCVVCPTPVLAALCALSHMAIAGEIAATRSYGVGSFAVGLLDQLQLLALDGDALRQRLKCDEYHPGGHCH